MIVAGIDYSTSSPAICITDTKKGPPVAGNVKWFSASTLAKRAGKYGNFAEISTINRYNKKADGIDKQHQNYLRNVWLARWAVQILVDNKVECVLIEEYAMSATGNMTSIAENTGQLKVAMALAGIKWEAKSVTDIKKTFAGAGRTPKAFKPAIDFDKKVTSADLGKAWMVDTFIEKTGIDLALVMELHLQDNKESGKCRYAKPVDDMVDAYAVMCMSAHVENL